MTTTAEHDHIDYQSAARERVGDAEWWQETLDGVNPIGGFLHNEHGGIAAEVLAESMRYLDSAFRDLEHLPIVQCGSICVVLQAIKRLQAEAMKRAEQHERV